MKSISDEYWIGVGTRTDNATIESFMGKMKFERLKHIEIKLSTKLDREVRMYCRYYNTERLHSRHAYQTNQQVK